MEEVRQDGTEQLRLQVRLLWAQACLWDEIDPGASFVVFSQENPYSASYDQAYQAWREQNNRK